MFSLLKVSILVKPFPLDPRMRLRIRFPVRRGHAREMKHLLRMPVPVARSEEPIFALINRYQRTISRQRRGAI
jgi:hypothetical protein